MSDSAQRPMRGAASNSAQVVVQSEAQLGSKAGRAKKCLFSVKTGAQLLAAPSQRKRRGWWFLFSSCCSTFSSGGFFSLTAGSPLRPHAGVLAGSSRHQAAVKVTDKWVFPHSEALKATSVSAGTLPGTERLWRNSVLRSGCCRWFSVPPPAFEGSDNENSSILFSGFPLQHMLT